MTIITFFCSILLLSLQISNSRTNDAETLYGVPGRTIKVRCSFSSSGEQMIFCKQNCEEKGNILIETSERKYTKGRYSITSVNGKKKSYFNVSISRLTQSDSGRYQCGLSSRSSYQDFILVVAEALLDGNKDHHFSKEAGSSLTVACSFGSSGRTGMFCKGGCKEEENVLVESSGDRVEKDRYILEYKKESGAVLLVTIKQLIQSDSGRYQCQLDIENWPDSYRYFTVSVTDAVDQSTTTTTTSRSFSSSFTHATTRQSFSSSSAGFTPSGSSETTKHPALGLEEKSSSDVLLLVGLTLAFILIVLAVALLVFCRKRSERQRKDPFVKSENTPATTTEVRNNENTSAAVQISTIYSYASYCTTAGAEGNDIYSLVTAVPPQNNAEDDLSKPTYAQLSFPNRSSDSPPGPSGRTDVVYSLPVVAGGGRAGEESLYSNTT
ncbi:uncharacterized protein V3H82_010855 isoform 3-T3 [Fundulus diaphanus]